MSKASERISQIRTEKVGDSNKRILLVEGESDKDAISIFLTTKYPEWEQKWILEAAGNKKQVIDLLRNENDWVGLIDKDEWTASEIKEKTDVLNNLLVLPRFCLESYLVEPAELWSALPEKQRIKFQNGFSEFSGIIDGHKDNWLRHAALWHIVNPLWRELRSSGFGIKKTLLDPNNIPSNEDFKTKLSEWHITLTPDQKVLELDALINEFYGETNFTFYTQRLYAKDFYPLVIHPMFDRLLGQKKATDRKISIFRHLPVPNDLDLLWQKMGLIA